MSTHICGRRNLVRNLESFARQFEWDIHFIHRIVWAKPAELIFNCNIFHCRQPLTSLSRSNNLERSLVDELRRQLLVLSEASSKQ